MKYTLVGFTFVLCLILGGCASGPSNYALYAETQAKIAQAHAVAETARFNALSEIAKNGDSAAKVAAVLSIQMGGNNQQRQQHVVAPESFADTALKWTSVLLPGFTQFYTVNRNSAVAMRQSDNQASIAISTNQTFGTIATAGNNANKDIASSGFNALQSSGVAGFNALTGVASLIQAPTTTSTITVQGNYNIGANSGNSGKVSGTSLIDNASSTTTP